MYVKGVTRTQRSPTIRTSPMFGCDGSASSYPRPIQQFNGELLGEPQR